MLSTIFLSFFLLFQTPFATPQPSVSPTPQASLSRDRRRSRLFKCSTVRRVRYATTNPFGFYRFTEVSAGATYILTAAHKRFGFATQIVSVNEERGDINFVASP